MERIRRNIKINDLLKDINDLIEIDLKVYSNDEWNKIVSVDSSFIREINNKGVKLI